MTDTIDECQNFLLPAIRRLHELIRLAVIEAISQSRLEEVSGVAEDLEGDTIYAIDKVSEEVLIGFVEREIAHRAPVVLVAEGLPNGFVVLPEGAAESDAKWRIIVDPIDGTRGFMYQKRSGWVLTGIAPNRGAQTSLSDIVLAVQTELPLAKQYLTDVLWAIRGQGANAVRHNLLTGEEQTLALRPTNEASIEHGHSSVVRFFPGARDVLAEIEEEVVLEALGPSKPGKASCFEDQYASTGGQLYELMMGHDRFVADLRPLMAGILKERGIPVGLCCHPYDLCTQLIAVEAGVLVQNPNGASLDALLSVDPDVSWVGFANSRIEKQIAPILRCNLKKRDLLV